MVHFSTVRARRALQKTETHAISFPIARARRCEPLEPDETERRNAFETFCTQLETQLDLFYFFARNPLKSPDSEK
jgi:hypothetical protein